MTTRGRRRFMQSSMAATGLRLGGAAAAVWSPANAGDRPLYLAIYRPGSGWLPGKPVNEQPLRDHGRYMLELYRQGRLKLAGAFADDSGGAAAFDARASLLKRQSRLPSVSARRPVLKMASELVIGQGSYDKFSTLGWTPVPHQRRAGSNQRTARAHLVLALMVARPDGDIFHCGARHTEQRERTLSECRSGVRIRCCTRAVQALRCR
jgi:hypothetical protein